MNSKYAASIILIRPKVRNGFEVLLVRHTSIRNRGKLYSFLGDSVNEDDYSEALLNRCIGLSPNHARNILGKNLTPELSLGHWVAAIRRLYEEVGLLFCTRRNNKSSSPRVYNYRSDLLNFRTILESEELLCNVSRLGYYSRWLSSGEFPEKFDIRFFLAILTPDHILNPNPQEIINSKWLIPEHCLTLCQQDKLLVDFSTYAVLRTLADFDSLDALVSEYGLHKSEV